MIDEKQTNIIEKKGIGGISFISETRNGLSESKKIAISVWNDNLEKAENTFKKILKEVKC